MPVAAREFLKSRIGAIFEVRFVKFSEMSKRAYNSYEAP